ncbi:hypothetical protein ACQCSX_21155 (plasmid) [Pseudarthrobacter sp. P1]|uniref:hypothetical protein n=1 Tax=Pseudarthrobacter sp. P1 TaxID=3418418 RepID=UPI003CF0E5AD
MPPDDVRHGTTTLFAAWKAADGSALPDLHRKHRTAKFRTVLAKIAAQVPAGLDVHLIRDNHWTQKTPAL